MYNNNNNKNKFIKYYFTKRKKLKFLECNENAFTITINNKYKNNK